MLKKIAISVLVSILFFTYSLLPMLTPTARAQDTSWYNQTYEEWVELVADKDNPDEIFGERYTAAQVRWIIYSLIWFLTTADEGVFSCLAEHDGSILECVDVIVEAAKKLGSADINNGTEKESSFLAMSTSRPISLITYLKDIANRLHIVPEAKAQGFGFAAASPILGLWRMVRNTTYFLLIIVVVIMAFMIMFRVKISPQAVITVQSALPKVILALILITFSYAIAGLLIDLMYVVIGLLAAIISGSGLVASPYDTNWGKMFEALTDRSLFGTMGLFFLWFMTALWVSMLSAGVVAAVLAVISLVIYPILMLIVAIILLIALFRILWLLLKTYVNVLLLVVFGPIQILLGVFGPGGFGAWIKKILANLAVYPATGFMFIIAFVFLRGAFWQWESLPGGGILTAGLDATMPFSVTQQLGGPAWNPPLTFGSGQLELVWLGASLVIVLLIPNIANIIKGMIEGRPFAYGTAIGQAIGAPFGWAWGSSPVRAFRQEYGEYQAGRFATRTGQVAKQIGLQDLGEMISKVGRRIKRE